MQWIRQRAKLAMVGIGVLAVLILLLCVEHHRATTLPETTGPYAVGRVSYEWVNTAESDPLAPAPGAKREVVAWIWYPAKATASSERAEYMPAAWRAALSHYV